MPTATAPIIHRVDKGRWKARYYYVEGDPDLSPEDYLPSVTSVLSVISKPALIPWAVNQALDNIRGVLTQQLALNEAAVKNLDDIEAVITLAKQRPEKIKDDAADIGTRAHAYIEAIQTEDELPAMDDDIEPCITAFLHWQEQEDIELEVSERMVYSKRFRYGGALDGIGVRRETKKKVILDWKTSNAIYPEYALQAAAYWWADFEMTGKKAEEVWVVRLPKTRPEKGQPDFEAVKVIDPMESLQAFIHARYLWDALKGDQLA